MVSVSSVAYTTVKDGLYTTYTWTWEGGLSSVRSDFIQTPGNYEPHMYIYARMFGTNVRQNGGVPYNDWKQYEYLSNYNPDDNEINVFASMGKYKSLNSELGEKYSVWLNTSTAVESFTSSNDFSFRVRLNTFDYYDHVSDEGDIDISNILESRIYLRNGGSYVYTLQPTVTNVQKYSTSVSGLYLYGYDVIFTLDNPNGEEVIFDSIIFSFPCAVNIKPYEALYGESFSRYRISVSDVELYEMPSAEVLEQLLIIEEGNSDMINKLGTINSVDQARINAQSSSFSEVATVTGGLSNMTDFSESLSSQVDLSQDVDILSDGDFVTQVSNMWAVFPWDSEFFVVALGMVGSIALLSLVLHGGERALFSGKSSSGGRGKSSKKGDDS